MTQPKTGETVAFRTYGENEWNATSHRLGAVQVSFRAEKQVILALG